MALAAAATAQFIPGNLAVSRVGDGGSALTNAGTQVFVDQYTVGGGLVNSVALPTVLSGGNLRHVNSGTATSELQLDLSADQQYLSLAGYDADLGTASIASSSATRMISRVAMDGSVDSSTGLGSIYSGNNIRSATTTNGVDFWAAGAAGGIAYSSLGGGGAMLISSNITNTRVIHSWNGDLYFTTSSGSTNRGIWKITGLPTSGTVTATQVIATGSSSSPYDFLFVDANTIYVADDSQNASGGIQKWTFDGSVWTRLYVGQQTANIGMRSLATDGMSIFAVTADNKLVQTTDNGVGFGAFTLIATAGTNTAFRGVEFIPGGSSETEPPSSFKVLRGTLLGGGLASLLDDDDEFLVIQRQKPTDIGPAAIGDEVQLQVGGTSSKMSPSSLSITVVSSVSATNLAQKISMYNWQTGAYELVDSRPGNLSDTGVTVSATGDLSRFVNQSTGAVRAKLSAKQNTMQVREAWTASYGQVYWSIQ
ncbi:MAG: hypothetical protein WAO58_06180 [Fimbriimonadaceae bacterium]